MCKIFIPDSQRRLITLDAWMKTDNPTSAQTLVLFSGSKLLEIAKEDMMCKYNFHDAQNAAAGYRKGFRCPTRHEAIEMYDARFRGLDEAFKKIGGSPVLTFGWTCEADSDLKYTSDIAFLYGGCNGDVSHDGKQNLYTVRPVAAFRK